MERVSSLIMCYIEFFCACVEPAFFLISNLKYSSWRMVLCCSGRTDKCTDHLPFAFASLENANRNNSGVLLIWFAAGK